MTTPIGPSQQPHSYSSQISPGDQIQLTPEMKAQLNKLIDMLERIKEKAHHFKGEAHELKNLVADLELFDHEHTHFLSDLNRHSNRALESQVKTAFETKFHHFADELKDIKNTKDPHETSLRDALFSTYKLPGFLEDLNKSPQGKESIHQIGDQAGIFAQELRTGFNLH